MSENGENLVKTAGADLRAMLMVGNNNSNSSGGGGKTRGGNRGRAKKAQSRISYDKDALMSIGKNAASQKRPEFLDPEYDSKPSQQALSMGASPTPRWDPEKWHSNTKPKRASNPSQTQSPLTLLASGQNKENNDWRKEENEQPEQRLGPQRRSFAGGCKPAQRAAAGENTSEIILGPKRGGNSGQAEKETRAWRPSRVRDSDNTNDDKFKDFRSEKPGHQRYSAAERFGGNNRHNRRGNFGRNYHDDNHSEDEVPEWMTDGPDTVHDVLNLDDCRLPKDQRKKDRPEQADSPELVAFDFSTGGVVAGGDDALGGGLEDDLPPQAQGLVDFHSKELDDLLEQIDSDDGIDAGVSRFSSFFNKPQPAPSQAPLESLQHHPRSDLGLRVQQQLDQRRPMVDPSVWAAAQQQQHQHAPPQPPTRPMAPPQLAADPAVLDMRSLQGLERTFQQPPPNLMKMNPLMQMPNPQNVAQLQQQQQHAPPPPPQQRAPPMAPPAQVMSLEELERGVNQTTPEATNAPAPEVKAMLLNLTRQKSDFEQKNNIQRMMLLQQPKQQQQQQQPPPIGQPPPPPSQQQQPIPSQYPNLGIRAPNSFGLGGEPGLGGGAINGLVGIPPMQQQQQPPPPPPPQQRNHNSQERERIYAYLMGEKRHRNLTPSEEKFLEKNAPPPPQPQQATATAELMSQMALHDEIQKQMAMMDPRNSRQQQAPPPPQIVNGLGARELEAHQQRQAEAQRRQQYQEHQKGISLERQKAQFEEFGRHQKNNNDKSVSSFTTHFTPTSVMRKMVRKTGDEDGRGGQRKITPLEHTGVVRVPKGDLRSKQKNIQQQQQQQQQAPNRNLLSQFPPLSSMNQGQPPHRQGNGAPAGGAPSSGVPPFMLQQLMFQGQSQSGQSRPPPMSGPPPPSDVFRQPPQGAQPPPRGFEQDNAPGNIHIEKLLNQQNYDY